MVETSEGDFIGIGPNEPSIYNVEDSEIFNDQLIVVGSFDFESERETKPQSFEPRITENRQWKNTIANPLKLQGKLANSANSHSSL